MPLYEVAILQQPTPERAAAGDQEKLVFGPKAVVAKDRKSASLEAVRMCSSANSLSSCRVLVRDFGS